MTIVRELRFIQAKQAFTLNSGCLSEKIDDNYLDEGLLEKLLSMWETPSKDEIDVWYTLERK